MVGAVSVPTGFKFGDVAKLAAPQGSDWQMAFEEERHRRLAIEAELAKVRQKMNGYADAIKGAQTAAHNAKDRAYRVNDHRRSMSVQIMAALIAADAVESDDWHDVAEDAVEATDALLRILYATPAEAGIKGTK